MLLESKTSKTILLFSTYNFPNYKVITNKIMMDTNSASYYINKKTSTFRKNEILNLTVDLFYDTEKRLRVQIYDTNRDRYEVPLDLETNRLRKSTNSDYFVQIIDEPFGIKIYRKTTQTLMYENFYVFKFFPVKMKFLISQSFDTSIAPLIFADQFIQFSTQLPNNYIYGIGEHQDSFQHITDWTKHTIWARDIGPEVMILFILIF